MGDSQSDWLRPSPLLSRLRLAEVSVVAVIVVVLAAVFPVGAGSTSDRLAGILVVLVASGVGYGIALRRVHAWGYRERDEDLLVTRGVMFRRLSVVPYGRMQFVDVSAGPLERIFGLATVKLHTAAAATDARIPGLPSAEAQRLRDSLALLGESKSMGL